MTGLPAFLAAALGIAFLLSWLAVVGQTRAMWRAVALFAFVAFVPIVLAAMVDLTGRLRPSTLEWLQRDAPEADVLAADVVPDKAIRLWLRLEPGGEPLAYALPWDQQTAQQLQDALREGEGSGTGVKMRNPFEPTLDPREPRFWAMPQPALPPKQAPESDVVQAPEVDA